MQSRSRYKLSARKSPADSRKSSSRTFRESCSETHGKRIGDRVNRTVVWPRLGRPFVSIAILRQQCLVPNSHTSRSNNAFHLSAGYTRSELGLRTTRLRYLEVRTDTILAISQESTSVNGLEGSFAIEERSAFLTLQRKIARGIVRRRSTNRESDFTPRLLVKERLTFRVTLKRDPLCKSRDTIHRRTCGIRE